MRSEHLDRLRPEPQYGYSEESLNQAPLQRPCSWPVANDDIEEPGKSTSSLAKKAKTGAARRYTGEDKSRRGFRQVRAQQKGAGNLPVV